MLNIIVGTINAPINLTIRLSTIMKHTGLKMKLSDENISLTAFSALCEELETSKLVDLEECQYWLFERGYNAAVKELIQNISVAARANVPVSLEQKYLTK